MLWDRAGQARAELVLAQEVEKVKHARIREDPVAPTAERVALAVQDDPWPVFRSMGYFPSCRWATSGLVATHCGNLDGAEEDLSELEQGQPVEWRRTTSPAMERIQEA